MDAFRIGGIVIGFVMVFLSWSLFAASTTEGIILFFAIFLFFESWRGK